MIIITLLVRTASLSCLNTPCLTSYGSGHSICISILHLGTAQPYPMVQLPGENRSTMLGQGFPGVSLSKESICNTGDAGDLGSVPGLWRFPGGGHGNQLLYSSLEGPIDRGAWWAIVHRVAKSQTRLKRLSTEKNKWECHYLCNQGCRDSNRMGLIFLVLTWLHMCKTKNKKNP